MVVSALLSLALFVSGQLDRRPHDITVKGTIVSSDGKPVPNAIVGAHPEMAADGSRFRFDGGVETDAQGRFEIKLNIPRTRFELSVFNADQSEGGYVLESEEKANDLTIKLAPIYPVSYEFMIPKELKKDKVHLSVSLGEGGGVWMSASGPAKGVLRLPPGKHFLAAYIFGDVHPIRQSFTVEGEAVKLTPVKFKLTPFALKYGKPPLPLYHTASRGLKKPFQWKDYLGKWVFVEQWAYWCVPCCFEALPHLMKFVNDNKDKRDRFAVITIHTVPSPDSGIKDFKTLQPMLNVIQKKAWGGKPLPFPILLDLEGKTMKSWGFTAADVQFLVDPKGNIVRGNVYEVLRQNGFK